MSHRRLIAALCGLLAAFPWSVSASHKTPSIDASAWLKDTSLASALTAPNQKPFELLIRFTTPGLRGGTVAGTYHYLWLNPSQWREESAIANFQELRVGGEQKFWQLSNTPSQPTAVAQLQDMLDILMHGFPANDSLKPSGSFTRPINGDSEDCLISKDKHESRTVCRDHASHALLRTMIDVHGFSGNFLKLPTRTEYSHYREFQGKEFPGELKYWVGSSLRVDATVEKLQPLGTLNGALFVPPSDAQEMHGCGGFSTPPQAIYAPDPGPPSGPHHSAAAVAVLDMRLGADGLVHFVAVQHSSGTSFDREAVRAAKQWRFNPATCDGEPVPMEINLDIRSSI